MKYSPVSCCSLTADWKSRIKGTNLFLTGQVSHFNVQSTFKPDRNSVTQNVLVYLVLFFNGLKLIDSDRFTKFAKNSGGFFHCFLTVKCLRVSPAVFLSLQTDKGRNAHMSMLVQLVVCQLDLLKGNHLLHQLLSGERRVRVDVQPAGEGEYPYLWLAEMFSGANVRCPIDA